MKKQFVRSARLHRDAYIKPLKDMLSQTIKKTFCECHPLTAYDPAKFSACFNCRKANYACCERRIQSSI